MKILLANKFYYRRGGAEVYMINLEEYFKAKGHDVAVFAMQHPQGLESPYSQYFPETVEYGKTNIKQLRLLVTRPFGTREVMRKYNALLDDFQPDVVHLNNMHTQLSPVVAQIAFERGIKIIWTVHDVKMLCPNYECLRNGKYICELCFTNKKHVVINRCMKNSLFASMIAYWEAIKWNREKLEKYTDVFVCPSQFMANKLIQGGFNKNKIVTLCNFIDVTKTENEKIDKEDYYCYIGRLIHYKGMKTMIEAAKQLPFQLKIVGDGPMLEELKQTTQNLNIEFLGHKNWDEIKVILSKARFSVIPSEWYENNPLSIIESKCLGTPVLGANIGGIPELIETGKSGLLFESRNVIDLKTKIEQMFAMNFDYRQLAEESQQQYSAEKYYHEILKIYNLN